ncbi:heavy-metal-associated domain-containing protein [Rubripirellula sp.]|nr:heavy-metal-associated domain-containing protein [Planctomycetaceae bacterium]MDA9858642.1 heavy-metal-associated domain-containing protein [Rubripirellula sp.]
MRAIVYSVAVLVAAGVMYVVATTPNDKADPGVQTVAAEPHDVMTEPGTLTLSVPSMHCEFACFPRVKESIESVAGVTEVALDEQKEEGVLDNRQVVVSYDAGFDLTSALANLSSEGFEDADIVQ